MPRNKKFTVDQAQDAAGALLLAAQGNVEFGYDNQANQLQATAADNVAALVTNTPPGSAAQVDPRDAALIGHSVAAPFATALGGRYNTLSAGSDFSVVLGGSSQVTPANLPNTVFVPRLHLLTAGEGVTFRSPGNQTFTLSISDAGVVLLNGNPITSNSPTGITSAVISRAGNTVTLITSAGNSQFTLPEEFTLTKLVEAVNPVSTVSATLGNDPAGPLVLRVANQAIQRPQIQDAFYNELTNFSLITGLSYNAATSELSLNTQSQVFRVPISITPGNFTLADGSVTTPKLAERAVTTAKLADGAVGTNQLTDGSVSNAKLGSGAVTTDKISPGTVSEDRLSSGVVTKLNAALTNSALSLNGQVLTLSTNKGNSSVTLPISTGGTFELADGSVTTPKLANGAVTTAKLANLAVANNNLQDESISYSKLNQPLQLALNSAVTEVYLSLSGNLLALETYDNVNGLMVSRVTLPTSSGGTFELLDGSVTTPKLATKAVTTAKIADGAVTTLQLGDASVTAGKLADNSVSASKIVDNTITNIKLANLSVSTGKLQDKSVTVAKLADDVLALFQASTQQKIIEVTFPSLGFRLYTFNPTQSDVGVYRSISHGGISFLKLTYNGTILINQAPPFPSINLNLVANVAIVFEVTPTTPNTACRVVLST
jgi:Repeat of unknown function (DUF5907)